MDNLIVSEFDSFIQTVGTALAGFQALEQENSDLKAELETTRKTVETLRLYLERKEVHVEELQQERYRISQELTQVSYDNGKVIQATEQASRLKYELDIANTTIAITRRELTALRTENERLRRNTTTNSHNSGSSSSYKRPAPPNSYYHSYK